ncbi:MAG: hypothetical protein OXG35_21900 [Acidobacteria bacterium]|nr:hypothetical protein [Acidobacteriota bacterium]
MKHFKMFIHPDGKVEAVKQGWSWPGCMVPHFWALYNRMWWLGFGLMLFNGLLSGLSNALYQVGQVELGLTLDFMSFFVLGGIAAAFGLKANEWREAKLRERGFQLSREIDAPSARTATVVFLTQRHA